MMANNIKQRAIFTGKQNNDPFYRIRYARPLTFI